MRNSIRNLHRLYNVSYNSISTINGRLSYDRVTDCLISLAEMVQETETGEFTLTDIGEGNEFCLADLIVGAYWHYTEYHGGQSSKGYKALSELSVIYWPNMETGPAPDSGEQNAYEMLRRLVTNQPITVYFRKFPDGDTIALWDDPDYENARGMIPSYQHIGQHSEASRELIDGLERVNFPDFLPLYDELESRGYRVILAEK